MVRDRTISAISAQGRRVEATNCRAVAVSKNAGCDFPPHTQAKVEQALGNRQFGGRRIARTPQASLQCVSPACAAVLFTRARAQLKYHHYCRQKGAATIARRPTTSCRCSDRSSGGSSGSKRLSGYPRAPILRASVDSSRAGVIVVGRK